MKNFWIRNGLWALAMLGTMGFVLGFFFLIGLAEKM